jgi:hypothetical protein
MLCLKFFAGRIKNEPDRAKYGVALEKLVVTKTFVLERGNGELYECSEDDAQKEVKAAAKQLMHDGHLDEKSLKIHMVVPPNSDFSFFDAYFVLCDEATRTPLIMRYHHGAGNKFTYHIPKNSGQYETLENLVSAVTQIINTLVLRGTADPADSHEA